MFKNLGKIDTFSGYVDSIDILLIRQFSEQKVIDVILISPNFLLAQDPEAGKSLQVATYRPGVSKCPS